MNLRGGLALSGILILVLLAQVYRTWTVRDSDGKEYLPIHGAHVLGYTVRVRCRAFVPTSREARSDENRFLVDLGTEPKGNTALYVETWHRNLDARDRDTLMVRSGEVTLSATGISSGEPLREALPLLNRAKPREWTVRMEGEMPLWPLLTWVPQVALAAGGGAASSSPPSVINPIDQEELQFFQQPPEVLALGTEKIECLKLLYLGHRSRMKDFHRIEGRLWLAPSVGIVREERTVIYQQEEGSSRNVVYQSELLRELVKTKDRS